MTKSVVTITGATNIGKVGQLLEEGHVFSIKYNSSKQSTTLNLNLTNLLDQEDKDKNKK